jgi:hypothetical protein
MENIRQKGRDEEMQKMDTVFPKDWKYLVLHNFCSAENLSAALYPHYGEELVHAPDDGLPSL